jgi:hypothetical protein
MIIARQRLGKQVPVATNKQTTIEVFLGYNDGNCVFCWIHPEDYITRIPDQLNIIEGVSSDGSRR